MLKKGRKSVTNDWFDSAFDTLEGDSNKVISEL